MKLFSLSPVFFVQLIHIQLTVYLNGKKVSTNPPLNLEYTVDSNDAQVNFVIVAFCQPGALQSFLSADGY